MRLVRKALLPVATRFVAGETMDSAIRYAETLEDRDILPLIDLLGEHIHDPDEVRAAREAYAELLTRLDAADIPGAISVKLTHLGLEIGYDHCLDTVHHLVEHADELDRFVWIDMESSDHTDETIRLYTDLLETHEHVGICLQAYLKRTEHDLHDVLNHGGIVRLVKGAYDEPRDIAYREHDAVSQAYRDLLQDLFAQDNYFAVATHDPELVNYTKYLREKHDRTVSDFEFQFLKGVQNQLKQELVADGYTVAEYVPYGPEWLAYYWRRVRERRENLVFAARSLLGG